MSNKKGNYQESSTKTPRVMFSRQKNPEHEKKKKDAVIENCTTN